MMSHQPETSGINEDISEDELMFDFKLELLLCLRREVKGQQGNIATTAWGFENGQFTLAGAPPAFILKV